MNPVEHDLESIRRQILARLTHLRRAGIDWLPRQDEPISSAAVPSGPPSNLPAPAETSMFDIAAEDETKPEMSVDERRLALQTLAEEIKGCTRCADLCTKRRQTVFGQGEPGVELCFLGEAPGEDEDRQGIPFVGAAGQMLNNIIKGSGLRREEVYICNILKCHPPGNRTPLANEAANCRAFLERQLELVKPKFIVALGGCAATNLLQTTLSIAKLRGRFHDYKGIPVLVTYHPAYLLDHKHPEKKREVWEDMKMLLQKMGRPRPQKT